MKNRDADVLIHFVRSFICLNKFCIQLKWFKKGKKTFKMIHDQIYIKNIFPMQEVYRLRRRVFQICPKMKPILDSCQLHLFLSSHYLLT